MRMRMPLFAAAIGLGSVLFACGEDTPSIQISLPGNPSHSHG
jgi:hypothetical protein